MFQGVHDKMRGAEKCRSRSSETHWSITENRSDNDLRVHRFNLTAQMWEEQFVIFGAADLLGWIIIC